MASWRSRSALLAAFVAIAGTTLPARAAPLQGAAPEPIAAALRVEPSGETATLTFVNRSIVVLRARVLGRGPAERVDGARRRLDDLVEHGVTGPVGSRSFEGGVLLTVASRPVVALTPPDVDELAGETVDGAAAQGIERLRLALAEAVEARTPGVLIRSSALAAAALLLALLLLWAIARAHRTVGDRLVAAAERTVTRSGLSDVNALRASRLLDVERWLVTALAIGLGLVVIYATAGFALRRFPYTRAWGESMRGYLLTTLENIGLGVAHAVPGLFTVIVILCIARFIARGIRAWFDAVERGQLTPRWIYPETAQPTRRLLIGLLWVFTIVVTYPYLPGSQTDAFKGVTVFLGLLVTFGSSGLVNQIMSGFMITYSRALRLGDFVRIGDVEGSVTHLGVLSTKVRTLRHEEVTIPNAVVVAQTTTDYSRMNGSDGVLTPTAVTIGYDAPWRQVHALLLAAAERTPGLRREPAPIVLQTALEDFYVKYTLLVCLERQESRPVTLHALHAAIQDLFNEHGVQIMSPHYMVDPAAPKVVARRDWFASPARRG